MRTFGAILLWVAIFAAYWAPTITAAIRHHRTAQVLVINLLLGWTAIGWIVALVFAVGPKQPTGPDHTRAPYGIY